MNKKLIVSLLCAVFVLAGSGVAKAQAPVTMTVTAYYDTNNNSLHDAGEGFMTLPNVTVELWLYDKNAKDQNKLIDSRYTSSGGVTTINVPTNAKGRFDVYMWMKGKYCLAWATFPPNQIPKSVKLRLHTAC